MDTNEITNEISDDDGLLSLSEKNESKSMKMKHVRMSSTEDDIGQEENLLLPKAQTRADTNQEKLIDSMDQNPKETPQFKQQEKPIDEVDQSPFFLDNYADYDDTKDFYGLSPIEIALFGDRCSENHEKIRIISKSHTQLYWLTLINEEEHDGKLFIEQQIP